MAGNRPKAAAAGRRISGSKAVPGDGSRTYFDVVRSLSSDPEVRRAVEETAKETQRAQVAQKR